MEHLPVLGVVSKHLAPVRRRLDHVRMLSHGNQSRLHAGHVAGSQHERPGDGRRVHPRAQAQRLDRYAVASAPRQPLAEFQQLNRLWVFGEFQRLNGPVLAAYRPVDHVADLGRQLVGALSNLVPAQELHQFLFGSSLTIHGRGNAHLRRNGFDWRRRWLAETGLADRREIHDILPLFGVAGAGRLFARLLHLAPFE